VLVGVLVAVSVGVLVGVLVAVSVGVLVGVLVAVSVGVLVGVLVAVSVGVLVGVLVAVSVGVLVGVLVAVSVGVLVGVLVAVSVGVLVGVDVFVDTTVGVNVAATTLPVDKLTKKLPSQTDVPGAQSLIFALVAAVANDTAESPITSTDVPNDDNGTEASTLTAVPFAHTATLQVCSADPMVVNVPIGYSTRVVGTPLLLKSTHTFASITPFAVREINTPNPSLLILLTFAVSV